MKSGALISAFRRPDSDTYDIHEGAKKKHLKDAKEKDAKEKDAKEKDAKEKGAKAVSSGIKKSGKK